MSLLLSNVAIAGNLSMSGGSGSGPAGDPYFSQVTLLAQFQGTNGSQTFIDSSSQHNAMSTYTGNPTISTANFTGTATSSLSSSFANQSSVTFDNSNGAANFSGDFTIEAWTYLTTVNSYPTIMRVSTGTGYFLLRAAGTDYEFDANGTHLYAQGGATNNVGQWTHIAVCRSGSTLALYVNGVSAATGTKSGTIGGTNSTSGSACISWPSGGEYWNGYLQDVRITNGVARYTGAFTPPTTLFPTN